MNFFKRILPIVVLFPISVLNAQLDLDSIYHVINTTQNDSQKVFLYKRLIYAHRNDMHKVDSFYNLGVNLANKSQQIRQIASIYNAKANVKFSNGDPDEAIRLFKHSLAFNDSLGYDANGAYSCYRLAFIYVNQHDINSAKKYLQRGFDIVNVNSNVYNQLLYQQKNIYQIEGKYDSALLTQEKIVARIKERGDDNGLFFAYMNMAEMYTSLYDYKHSVEYLNKALLQADSAVNLKGTSMLYNLIGDFFLNHQHNYDVALQYYQRSLELVKGKVNWQEARLKSYMGNVYAAKRNDTLAMRYYLESIEISKKLEDEFAVAETYEAIGDLYMNIRKQPDMAIPYYLQTLDYNCVKCPRSFHNRLHVKLGDAFREKGNYNQAIHYYNKSYENAVGLNSCRELAITSSKFAYAYLAMQQYSSAEKWALDALNSAMNCDVPSALLHAYEVLENVYSKSKKHEKAHLYLSKYQQLNDSLNNQERVQELTQLQSRFELERLEKIKRKELMEQRAIADEKIAHQKFIRNLFILGFIIVSILVFITFKIYRKKKKYYDILQKQNEEINNISKELEIRLQENIEQRQNIEEMSHKVHEADQMKLRFYTNLSHELLTPLTLITGPASYLMESSGIAENKKLKLIYDNAEKLKQMVQQLLDLRKLDIQNIEPKPKRSDIVQCIQQTTSSFSDIAQKHNLSLYFQASHSKIETEFDSDIIQKILNNLLSNAIKYTEPYGKIHVRVILDNHQLQLSVLDTGIGIPGSQINQIFQRFYRASNYSSTQASGTGIGLAITRELTELLNGTIEVESEENVGSKFTVRIHLSNIENVVVTGEIKNELAHAYYDNKNDEQENDEPENTASEDSRKKSLLIIDDNNEIVSFVADIMSDEYNIITAINGKQGLEYCTEHLPDLVISDIMMPLLNGIEMCEQLKNDERTSHIPIILLTAYDNDDRRLESLKSAADDYMPKPFEPKLLKEKVRNLIQIRENLIEKYSRNFVFAPSDINVESLDEKFLKKTRDIIEENLSNSEFDVELLASSLGVSKVQLYRKLKALTNCSANQLIRNMRLMRAAQLLQQSGMNVSEILFEVGFSNRSYFTQCFREMFGKTPSEFATDSGAASFSYLMSNKEQMN